MNIWIVNPYGTLPSEGWREYRSAMLARALAERGHQVRWWISDIEHRSKQRRSFGIVDRLLPTAVTIEIVSAHAYRRNISIGRILYERSFAKGFGRISRSLPQPDLIVLADPSLFFAGPVIHYAKCHDVPFILDVLDLWPEMFHVLLPQMLSGFGRLLFAPLYRRRNRLVEEAAAVIAVTGDYLDQTTRQTKAKLGRTIYLGVDHRGFREPRFERDKTSPLEIIYAGTLGDAYDMPTVLAVIGRLAEARCPVRFTVAGDGPWQRQLRGMADRYPHHLRFLGRIPADELRDHYAQAHIGLATYASGSTVSMPVKLFDYMAAGLATIGSMQGEASVLLRQGAGRVYRAGQVEDLLAAITFYLANPSSLLLARRFAFDKSKEYDQAIQHKEFAMMIEGVMQRKATGC